MLGSRRLREFCTHRVFRELGHDLIGLDVCLYWEQAVYKYPERPRRFPWHRDNGYTYVEPQQYVTCWVALTDATRDNGCPRVVPGRRIRVGIRPARRLPAEPVAYPRSAAIRSAARQPSSTSPSTPSPASPARGS